MTLGYGWIGQINKRIDESDFWLFEMSIWLHVLARSLVGVFIPVFLYDAGFSVKEIIAYYTLFHAIDIPLNIIAPVLIRRYGARIVLAMSTVAIIGFFAILSLVQTGDWNVLVVLAIVAAIYDVLYWNSHLFLFIQSNQDDKMTDRNTGVLFSVKRLAMLIGPMIGAGFLVYGEGNLLLLVSIVLFLVSLIPLVKVDDFPDKPTGPVWGVREFFGHREERKNYISIMLYGVHRAVEFIIWPLFIYITLESVESVALVPMVIAATTILFTLFLSNKVANFRGVLVAFGAGALAVVWMIRFFVQTDIVIYASMFIAAFFMLLVSIPLNAAIFDRAMSTDPLSATMYRNMFGMIGRFLMFLLLFVLVQVFEVSFMVAAFTLILLAAFNGFILILKNRDFEDLFDPKFFHNLEEH
jgi:MFS family permease